MKALKKTALAAILVLLTLSFVTCEDLAGIIAGQNDEPEVVDWEYEELPDGSAYLTLYFEDKVPVTDKTKRQQPSRSLDLPLAKMSHDYFEVVFAYAPTTGDPTIARATWELGQSSGISGVFRSANGTLEGVDYRPVAYPAAGTGASIVFVGRKQTMTLLGVGFLTHINKQEITGTGTATSKYLTTSDRSVTFTVSPLKAQIGINPNTGLAVTSPDSSFLTSVGVNYAGDKTTPSAAQTIGNVTALGGTDYPLFELPEYDHAGAVKTVPANPPTGLVLSDGTVLPPGTVYKTIAAQYTVDGLTGVAGATGSVYVVPNSGNLTPAVLLYGIPEIIKREPRYIAGGQTWYAVAQIDYRATLVDLDQTIYGTGLIPGATPGDVTPPLNEGTNPATGGVRGLPIKSVIPMNFYLTPPSNGIFSIVFSVPVYALTLLPSTNGNAAPTAEIWHITPGYGQNLYNLDNGIDAGGCVLMGINVTSLDWLEIFTTGIGFNH